MGLLKGCVFAFGALPWVLFALPGSFDAFGKFGALFATLCHQRPERSLSHEGVHMVVCSRCGGLYFGMALAALTLIPKRWLDHARWVIGLCVVPALIDVITQDIGLHAPWTPSRLVTGFVMGWVGTGLALRALHDEVTAARQPR
jgi:uncharacterized membrane protein